jgi:hypothetical protein
LIKNIPGKSGRGKRRAAPAGGDLGKIKSFMKSRPSWACYDEGNMFLFEVQKGGDKLFISETPGQQRPLKDESDIQLVLESMARE